MCLNYVLWKYAFNVNIGIFKFKHIQENYCLDWENRDSFFTEKNWWISIVNLNALPLGWTLEDNYGWVKHLLISSVTIYSSLLLTLQDFYTLPSFKMIFIFTILFVQVSPTYSFPFSYGQRIQPIQLATYACLWHMLEILRHLEGCFVHKYHLSTTSATKSKCFPLLIPYKLAHWRNCLKWTG